MWEDLSFTSWCPGDYIITGVPWPWTIYPEIFAVSGTLGDLDLDFQEYRYNIAYSICNLMHMYCIYIHLYRMLAGLPPPSTLGGGHNRSRRSYNAVPRTKHKLAEGLRESLKPRLLERLKSNEAEEVW